MSQASQIDNALQSAEHNLQLSERFVAAVTSGQLELLADMVHPEFELHHASTLPYAGVYKGLDGFLRFIDIFMGTYELERLESLDSFTSKSGAVIVEIAIKGTFKISGSSIDTTMLEKWEFKDGKVWRITPHYFDPSPKTGTTDAQVKLSTTEKSSDGGIHIVDLIGPCDDWRILAPGLEARPIRACAESGTWVMLYKVAAGTTASAHIHFGSSDSYLLKGKMETGGGIEKGGKTISAGDYIFEPYSNRQHNGTFFPEESLLLYIHYGPLMYVDEAGNFKAMADALVTRQLMQQGA